MMCCILVRCEKAKDLNSEFSLDFRDKHLGGGERNFSVVCLVVEKWWEKEIKMES
jgi:hypothetical protein